MDFASERNAERHINPTQLADVVEIFSDSRYRLGLADVQPGFLMAHLMRHAPQERQGGMTSTDTAPVLAEGHIQGPMQTVLNAPVELCTGFR